MLLRRTSLQALSVKTSARTGMTTRLTALATTHRVIDGVHHDTTVVRTTTQPAAATSLAALLESVVRVAYHTYSSAACQKHLTGFSGRQFDYRIVSLTGSKLSECAGRTCHSGTLTGT